jgi:hypothetical protein
LKEKWDPNESSMLRGKKKEAHEIDQLMKRGQRNETEKIKDPQMN